MLIIIFDHILLHYHAFLNLVLIYFSCNLKNQTRKIAYGAFVLMMFLKIFYVILKIKKTMISYNIMKASKIKDLNLEAV